MDPRRPGRRRAARRGLTLLELLVAMFVLGVGVLGLMAALPVLAASGARVEGTLEASAALPMILDTLREGARRHTHVVWDATGSRGEPRSVYMLLPFGSAGGATESPPGAAPPGVFGERGCILLPFGTDAVFTYPRAGDATEVAAKNGGGDATRAQEALTPEALYPLVPAPGDGAHAAFALRVQRARVAGQPRDGLYVFAVLLYRAQAAAPGEDLGRLVAQVVTELAVGPASGLEQHTAPPGADVRDWVITNQEERLRRRKRGRR